MSAIEFEPMPAMTAPPLSTTESIESAEAECRTRERFLTSLKAVVQVKETAETTWKEVARVTTVARNGVGISLSRPCTVGRLVNLVLPMPREYRAYDLYEEMYNVVGIVQHCNIMTIDGQPVYQVGVGLVGKEVPESFKTDPKQNYRITGMQPNGLWGITEAASQFRVRKNPRYWVTLPVTIGLIHRDDAVRKQDTFAKNVSLAGASVTTSLNVRVGEKLRFVCPALNFYAIAVVRNVRRESEQTATLHLQFDGQQFPIDLILPASGAAPR